MFDVKETKYCIGLNNNNNNNKVFEILLLLITRELLYILSSHYSSIFNNLRIFFFFITDIDIGTYTIGTIAKKCSVYPLEFVFKLIKLQFGYAYYLSTILILGVYIS